MNNYKPGTLFIVLSFIFTLLGLTQSVVLNLTDLSIHSDHNTLLLGGFLLATVVYSCVSPIHFKHVLVTQLGTFISAYLLIHTGALFSPVPAFFWFYVLAVVLLANLSLKYLAELPDRQIPQLVMTALFGFWCLYVWQLSVTFLHVPQVLLPTPTAIAGALATHSAMLWGDFVQTVVKAVVAGYLLGNGLGIVTGILIERSPFLQRGFLPLANLTSTIPLVGIAPIAVMWFGFDWPSKAAVIVLVTYFPALVSTLAGLHSTNKLEGELMYSYGANYWVTLKMLRLPAAMPFIFNALKVNSALALITAIVAEYFGSPTVGLGFRISVEAARMHMPIVWSAIVVASVAGSLIYAVLVYLERRVTFWHPAIRKA
ncbi:ABC transporter permease [Celerinatantimonas yamalensis]|uniref:ABC transporter permease n=1 Tax=Celerinatantimonas yamalensis TaxID=559956 RepID=A0ABW9G6N1_9GAMM